MSIVRSMILGTALWVGAAGVFPAGAVAEAQRGQCKQEISQLCAGAERGPARRECVTKNFDRLSPPCQERIRTRRAKHQEQVPTPEGGATQ
jgi:hypothetical protein